MNFCSRWPSARINWPEIFSVPPRRINEIVLGKRAITADTALRLARYFGSSEKFWLGLQDDYDLEEANKKMGETLVQISAVA